MIGSLQKNKARKAVESFDMIESVDTPDLAEKISHVGVALNTVVPVLLQVNTSGELSKHGLDPFRWRESFSAVAKLPGIRIEGLMTMAPFTEDKALVRRCFAELRLLRDRLAGIGPHLSMGMSNDYLEAIAEGATIVRVGSLLF